MEPDDPLPWTHLVRARNRVGDAALVCGVLFLASR
jgi:hypothetical protein